MEKRLYKDAVLQEVGLFKEYKEKWLMIPVIITAILYTVTMSHSDAYAIAFWGKGFLISARIGQLRDFATFAQNLFVADNYNVAVTIANAIWFLPVYILDVFVTGDIPLLIYTFWLKILMLFVSIYSGKVLVDIADTYGIDRYRSLWGLIMYFMSGAMMHGIIGGGQIDIVGALFLMLAFLSYRKGKMTQMAVFASLLLVVKELGFLYYIPLLVLVFFNDIRALIKHVVIIVIPMLVNRILEHTFFIDYAAIKADANDQWHHIDRLFDINIEEVPIFLSIYVAIVLLCLIKSWRKDVKEYDDIMILLVVHAAFTAFVIWSPQWLIYGNWVLIIACMMMPKLAETAVLPTVISIGYWIKVISAFATSNDNAMFTGGVYNFREQRHFMGNSIYGYISQMMPGIARFFPAIGNAVIVGGLACVVYLFIRRMQLDKPQSFDEQDNAAGLPWCYVCFFVMIVISLSFCASVIYTFVTTPVM